MDVWAMTLGCLAFAFAKPEMTPPTENLIREKSPFNDTFLITMTNGGMKYMPDESAYQRFAWEAQSAPVACGAAEKYAETAGALLEASEKGSEES